MRPGLVPWAKAGIIIKASTTPGSAYAAMTVTGSHGVRMQDDFTQDVAGLPGAVSATTPRWLRLTRSGDTITGYDSADGTHWTRVDTVTLAGLPSTAQVGLFATSPGFLQTSLGEASSSGGPSTATGVFDKIDLTWSGGSWALGIATAIRDSAVAVGVVLGLLYLFPVLEAAVSSSSWHRHLEQISPMTAGLAVQATSSLASSPISPWAGLGVLAAWAAGALLVGALVLRLRDA
jgi:hypothetical protein